MNAPRPARIALAVGLAAGLALPASAVARGGGGGASTPVPTAPPVQCDYSLDGPVQGGYAFSNQVGDAGCVTALSTTAGTVRLHSVAATPGWTWTSSTNTTGIKVTFTNTATGARAEARIEPGKTDIRG
jgi:hypothetical protein